MALLSFLLLGMLLAFAASLSPWLLRTEELSLSLLSSSEASCCLGPEDRPLAPCGASYSPLVLHHEPCCDLLRTLANSSTALSGCLMLNARPLRPCQSCEPEHRLLQEQMRNLSLALQQENKTDSYRCAINILQCDRMQIVQRLNDSFEQIWEDSNCALCLRNEGEGLLNDSKDFMEMFNATMHCFEQNRLETTRIFSQEGNVSKVCTNCSTIYKDLNGLYSRMEKGNTLCVDIEDALSA
ncbi:osteopetrosis-associated transmembrane protein 1 isoform X2 [Ambystoma mexicanum]|uniref:osteopetrosis-associated transmembrane protein 1 isoform X2 n=1 Tax=Ambystoma mexicanum TaxID=8296 RepID=UPI0037E963B1